jgi:maltose O-acetyltransferase
VAKRERDNMVLEELIGLPGKLRLMWLVKKGLKLGNNCYIVPSVKIDASFPWLISIGDNCTITANAVILSHDASTKRDLGYSKIGVVIIGNNVFVGAGAIILPNVHVGNNVIIGAGSVVTRDIPENSIVVGNPAKVICTRQEFIDRHSKKLRNGISFSKDGWTDGHGLTEERKSIMKERVEGKGGYAY